MELSSRVERGAANSFGNSSVERTDPDGTQHLLMHFYVRHPNEDGLED